MDFGDFGVTHSLMTREDGAGSAELVGDSHALRWARRGSVFVSATLAQRVFEDLWVYAAPSLGAGLPLYDEVAPIFVGTFECPVGLSWELGRWALFVEGGFYPPTQGAALLGGVSWQL